MRSINATLTTAQKLLNATPYRSLVIGPPGGTTYDASAYLVGYRYEEQPEVPGRHELTLNNAAGTFNTLTGDLAPITVGAPITLDRGVTIETTDYSAELPRVWIEALEYTYRQSRATLILHCIDAWEKLRRTRLTTDTTYTEETATTIATAIVEAAGLTFSGELADLTLTFEILTTENLLNALDRLLRLVPQYAYFGLDGAMKAKELDPAEESVYTLGWNADHKLQEVQRSIDRAWEANRVTVTGAGAYTGTAEDATQIAAVGTRQLTAHDVLLTSDAECLAAATALLRYFQARAQETILYTHPIHGLELFDVLTLDTPPWGGANVSGRVIGYLEIYDHVKGYYRQVITFGYPRHYVNRSTKDGSEIINIPGSAIVLESLQALTARTGNLQVDGELEIGTDGYLHSGQTSYGTGTGFWMEYNEGTPRLSIGTAAGNRVTWNGTTLNIRGTVHAELGQLDELDVKGELSIKTGGVLRSNQTDYNEGTGFWMEYNSGTPRFSIGKAGGRRMTWDGTDLTIRGDITAEDGELQDLDVKGTLTIGSGGEIRSGQTAYNTGTGFWMEYHSGSPRFSIGNSSGRRLTWDGSGLTIIADITAEDGELQDLDVKGKLTLGTSGVIRAGQTSYNNGTGFWMEYNGGTPRFSIGHDDGNRITWSGSTLTIVGDITAESGELEDLDVTGTLDLSGSGKLLTRSSPNPRIEINTSYLAGYSDATTKEFYLDASTGLAYAGGGKVKLTSDGLYIRTPSSFMDSQSIRFVTDDSDEYDLLADKVQYTGGSITHQHLIGADSSEKPQGSFMQTHLFGTGTSQWYVYVAALSPSSGSTMLSLTNSPSTNLSQLKFYGASGVEVDFEGSMSVESLRVGTYDPAARPSTDDVIIDGGLVVGAVDGTENPPLGSVVIRDGRAAPASSITGMAIIYIDTADGDLKIRFADGFVAVIVADS